MGKEIRTPYGVIDIEKNVIAILAGIATTECFGVVGVVSSRVLSDGIQELLRGPSLAKGVDVMIKEDSLQIRVNIVVGYGTRISAIATNVIDNVKHIVEKHTGLTVNKVEVNVQGIRVLD